MLGLAHVLAGPGLLFQRLAAMLSLLDPRNIDTDQFLRAMAETDPDYISYLDGQSLRRPDERLEQEEQLWRR